MTCPLVCTKCNPIKAAEVPAPGGERLLPSTAVCPSVRSPTVLPRGPAAGRRASRQTDGSGDLKASLPQDGDLQINVKAARGEGSSPGNKKKNLGLCSFCIPGAALLIIALTGLRVTKNLPGWRGGSRWGFSMELKFRKN